MEFKRDLLTGSVVIIISGIVLILSEFIDWSSETSALQIYQLLLDQGEALIYLVPLIAGCLIIIIGLGLLFLNDPQRKLLLIGMILALNLIFLFLYDIFQIHGQYLWKYPGIFTVIGAVSLLLIGLLLIAFDIQKLPSTKNANDVDDELEKT